MLKFPLRPIIHVARLKFQFDRFLFTWFTDIIIIFFCWSILRSQYIFTHISTLRSHICLHHGSIFTIFHTAVPFTNHLSCTSNRIPTTDTRHNTHTYKKNREQKNNRRPKTIFFRIAKQNRPQNRIYDQRDQNTKPNTVVPSIQSWFLTCLVCFRFIPINVYAGCTIHRRPWKWRCRGGEKQQPPSLKTCRPADLQIWRVWEGKKRAREQKREIEKEEKVLRKCNLDRVQYNSWISFIRLEPYGWQSTMFHFVSVRFYADGPNVLVRECVHQVVFPSHLDF